MKEVVVALFALLALTATVSLGFFYWQYRSWPPRLWVSRLARRIEGMKARRAELLATKDGRAGVSATRRLFDDLFRGHLRSIPVGELDRFPGIGPGTVDRVRAGGGRTLYDLTDFPFERLQGIGPAKGHDLRTAVRSLVREARSRFDAGACPEAQEYRRQLAALTAGERESAVRRDAEVAAIDEALAEAAELVELARDVTFWNYLFHREVPGLTDEVMARPLPSPKEVAPVSVAPNAPPVARPPEVRVPTATAVARPVAGPTAAKSGDLFQAALQTASPATREEHPWLPKLRAVVRFGFLMAKADGRIAQAEKKVLRQYLGEKFGHDGALLRQIDPLMEATEKTGLDEPTVLADVRSVTNAAEQRDLYALAERITGASGERNERERKALERIAFAFELKPVERGASAPRENEPRSEAPRGTPQAPTPQSPSRGADAPRSMRSLDPLSVLEIEPAAALSPDLIRRRYTQLSEKLDPARAAALGPEFAAMAACKRSDLRRAAEALIAPFGVPLDPPAAPPAPADLRHNPDLDDVFGG